MVSAISVTHDKDERIPPRARLLGAAADLFYRHGIKAVGVEAIAEAAGTNKMTLYRHFDSKDELVAEYLRRLSQRDDTFWDQIEAQHPGDHRAQLHAWLREMAKHVTNRDERGCPLANAAVELPEKDHPGRRVVETCKCAKRNRLVRLCRDANLSEPELLADGLFLILEGALVTAQSMGPAGPSSLLVRMGETLIASHAK